MASVGEPVISVFRAGPATSHHGQPPPSPPSPPAATTTTTNHHYQHNSISNTHVIASTNTHTSPSPHNNNAILNAFPIAPLHFPTTSRTKPTPAPRTTATFRLPNTDISFAREEETVGLVQQPHPQESDERNVLFSGGVRRPCGGLHDLTNSHHNHQEWQW